MIISEKKAPSHPRSAAHRFFLGLCLLVLAVLALYGTLGVGQTTSDDLVYEHYVITGRLGELTQTMAQGAGRFHHYLHVGLTSLPYFLDSAPLRRAAALLPFLGCIASLAWIAGRMFASEALGFLTALLCLAFFQDNWHHNILTAYPLVFDLGFLCLLWALYCLWRYLDSGRLRLLVLTNLLSFLAYCHFEAFVCYLPVLWGLVLWRGQGTAQAKVRAMLAASAAVPVYLVLYLGYRWLHPSQYGGNALALADPVRILKTVAAYSLGAFPLAGFSLNLDFINRFPVITNQFVFSFGQYLANLAANWPRLAPSWLAMALVTGGVTWFVLARSGIAWRFRALPTALMAYAVFCPNILIGLSPKYQAALDHGDFWYCTTTFSFYAIALGLALTALFVAGRLASRPAARRTLAASLAVAAALATLVNASVNASVLQSKVASRARWRAVDLLAKSPALAALPEHAVLVAPQLFSAVHEEHAGPDYWEAYLARRTGRQVQVVERLDQDVLPREPLFALRLLSAPTDRTTVVALAQVARLGPPSADPYQPRPDAPELLAGRVTVLADATNRYFDIFYQDKGALRQKPASATGPAPGYAQTEITGASIAVDSLIALPAGAAMAYAPSPLILRFGPGFAAAEASIAGPIVWAGDRAEMLLRNTGDAVATVRLGFSLVAFSPLRLNVSGPGLSIELNTAGLSTPVSLELPLPSGETRLVFSAAPPTAEAKRFGILGATVEPAGDGP